MLPVIGVIAAGIGRLVAAPMLIALGMKALITTMVVTIVPLVVYNLLVKVLKEISEMVMGQMGDFQGASPIVQMTGMGGWIADQMQVPEAITIVFTAVALRFTLNLITLRP